jgi:sulfite reductase (ferredoxin)
MGSIADVKVAKETKAQKVERLKRSKNPWEAFDEIKAFARAGRAAVLPEWANLYFKWWGIYTQGDGAGAIGGQGGEGKATEYFMMRIGLPNGLLRSSQLRKIADLSERYGRSLADLTVRQNIQLHWLSIESIPEVMEALAAEGLGPKGACGDVARNLTGCPLAGVAADEFCDASPLAVEASRLLSGNDAFYNLPRKFKVSITGCPVWCSYPEINDIGLTAVERMRNGQKEIGFSVRVGGGLSADPHLAVRLNAFIRWDQALAVVRGIAEMFREQDVLRENRERARLKHLFTQHHWTADRFLWELTERLGFQLDPAAEEFPPRDEYRDHVGIHAQKQPDRFYVGAAVLRGRITPDQMRAAAALADQFATGELRTTNMQNLLIINVPSANVEALACELDAAGLRVNASPFWRGAIACTGAEFCKLAITETKANAHNARKLKKIKQHNDLTDAYYFCLGGAVGEFQRIARPVGYRCTAGEVPAAIERLLRSYLANRGTGENLRAYFSRFSDDDLRAQLAGRAVEAVVRDASPGPVPHGVGD